MPFYSTVTSSQVWFVSMISNVVSFIIERDAVFNFLLRTYSHTQPHTNERAREREIDSWGSIQMLFSYVLFIQRFMCLTLFSSIYAVNEFLFSFRFTPELHCESSSCNNQVVYIRELQQLNGFSREHPLKMYFHVMFSLLFSSLLEPIQMKWKHNLNANWYRKLIFYIQTSISDEMAMWNIWFVFSPLLSWCYEKFFSFSTPRIGVII